MKAYRLSEEAAEDLRRLYGVGIDTFGQRRADRYVDTLLQALREIATHPYRWPAVRGLTKPYRRRVLDAHSVYFRVLNEDEVLIVRILGREDLENALQL